MKTVLYLGHCKEGSHAVNCFSYFCNHQTLRTASTHFGPATFILSSNYKITNMRIYTNITEVVKYPTV